MSPQPVPEPNIGHHANGALTVIQTDGNGGRVTITASAHAQPWLVRRAMLALMPHLMPGARRDPA